MRYSEIFKNQENIIDRISVAIKSYGKRLKINILCGKFNEPYGNPRPALEVTDFFARYPGNGGGTKILNLLIKLCNENNLPIFISPSSSRNTEFYKKFGFEKSSFFSYMVHYPPYKDEDDLEELDENENTDFDKWFRWVIFHPDQARRADNYEPEELNEGIKREIGINDKIIKSICDNYDVDREEVLGLYNDIMSLTKNDHLEIWREITRPKNTKMDRRTYPGKYWTYDKEKAHAYYGYGYGFDKWLLHAIIPIRLINWKKTLIANITDSHEKEITVYPIRFNYDAEKITR